MVSLSPLMSSYGALLEGLTTVRGLFLWYRSQNQIIAEPSLAFAVQSRFQDRVIAVTDTFQKMDHFYW